jgi:CARDB
VAGWSASAAARRAPGANELRNSGASGLFSRSMLRRLLIAPVLATAVVAAATAPAVSDVGLPASVKVKECSIEDESALFIARMRQIEGSDHMWLRFKLLEKGDTGFHVLKAPGLGRWRKSKPGVGTFAYKQAVRGLESGSLYRAAVDFRWYDAEDNLLQTTRRRSQACRQFDVLPNLTATPIAAKTLRQQGVIGYRVLVTNEGIAAATGVPVRLSVDGDVVDTVTVPALAPAERRVLTIQGPACTRSVKAEADPDGVIVESSESDNAHEIDCAALQSS